MRERRISHAQPMEAGQVRLSVICSKTLQGSSTFWRDAGLYIAVLEVTKINGIASILKKPRIEAMRHIGAPLWCQVRILIFIQKKT
jgi:hypothetical protein